MFLQFEGVEGKSEGRKKDSFKNRLCHLPPPPGGRTNRGQSGWESKQKCVSLAPASKKPDPRAPETEPEDKALGGGRAGEGSELCRFQILPCPVSRRQCAMSPQTNSMGKPARRDDRGVCEGRRFPPIMFLLGFLMC